MIHSYMYLLIHKNLVICYVSLPVRLGRVSRKWYWQKKWFMVRINKGEVALQSTACFLFLKCVLTLFLDCTNMVYGWSKGGLQSLFIAMQGIGSPLACA